MHRLLTAAAALLLAASVVCAATPMPADANAAKSLDGVWRFKLEQAKPKSVDPEKGWMQKVAIDYPATFEPFFEGDYTEGDGWHDIKVPSNWEMAGYSPATYNQPDNASGFYRLPFDVPAEWKGRIVKINFDGVQNGAEIWLNGQPVRVDEPSWGRENYHEGGWTAFQVDLTPHVKFGEKNLLALRVTKNTKSSELDSGDYFFLGGVHRTVTLFAVPKTHFADVKIETKLLDGGKAAQVKAIATVAGGAASVRMIGFGGDKSDKIEAPGQVVITQRVENPKLWSAEFPNRYPMTLELKGADGSTETSQQKVGIREVMIKDAVLLVNGVKVKFAGICRHDVSAENGTAVGPALWRKDIELMKAANINAIRTSHYPYGRGFYELCDELGVYVMDELPYCWTPTDDKEMEPAFTQRARETVARDKNFASVVLWAVGNENKEGRSLQVVADLVKRLDETRPRAVSWFGGAKYNTELSDSHYTKPDAIEKSAIRAKEVGRPHIYLENPNNWEVRLGADPGAWERWGLVLERCWDVVTKYDTLPGTFLWEWQDRAVADKSQTKLYDFFPETGINLLKIKGTVDAFRNPRPWYYDVKMIYAPIRVGDDAKVDGGKATFDVENRYSFTDLSQLKTKWQLLSGDRAIADGEATPACAPLSKGKVELSIPVDAAGKADALRVDFIHPDGRQITAHQYALKPAKSESRIAGPMKDGAFPQFNLITRETKKDPAKWRKIDRFPVTLANARTESGTMTADLIGGPDKKPVGKLRATLAGDKFDYTVEWTGPAKSEVQELGWSIAMPKSFDRFSWDRVARWTVYPDKHISRPRGTATPDSISTQYTKVDRTDAFDFNSTKYDCNAASLTNAAGGGVRVEFAAKQRFHCRGGADGDRTILFVNQQVSPPEDLSTNVVRDLYLTLNPGDKITGSFRIGANAKSGQ
jgi:beta-galactosidase/beta-glucuronidase